MEVIPFGQIPSQGASGQVILYREECCRLPKMGSVCRFQNLSVIFIISVADRSAVMYFSYLS